MEPQEEFPWGKITSKAKNLYLHRFRESEGEAIILPGLNFAPVKVSSLKTGIEIPFSCKELSFIKGHLIKLELKLDDVDISDFSECLKIEFDKEDVVSYDWPIALTNSIPTYLDVRNAFVYNKEKSHIEWKFYAETPGEYTVALQSKETSSHLDLKWYAENLEGKLVFEERDIPFKLSRDKEIDEPALYYWKIIESKLQSISITSSGLHSIKILDLPFTDSKFDEYLANVARLALYPK